MSLHSTNLKATGNGVHDQRGHCAAIAYDPDEAVGKGRKDVAHANAQLFAAAPDLLAALKNLAEKVDQYKFQGWAKDIGEAYAKALEAVALAEKGVGCANPVG